MERNPKKRHRIQRLLSLKDDYNGWNIPKIIGISIFITLLLLTFFVTMFFAIGVGENLLIIDPIAHTISEPVKGPSWGIKLPWQSAVVLYTATDSLGMWGDGTDEYANYPSIACFSRDQLEMEMDVLVRWQLDASKIKQLYENYPLKNWKETTIASIIREQIRITTKEWSAIQTIEERDIVRSKIAEAIETKLKTESSLAGVIINFEFELRNIGYPQTYTEAIEAKLAAEQAKIQAEYEASKIIILASADAQKVLINANATAQAKIIDSRGLQEAINLLIKDVPMNQEEHNKFLSTYITLKALENMAKEKGVYFFVGMDGKGNIFIQPTSP